MPFDIVAEFESIVTRLAERGVEYAVCGGFAVNIHGHVRATRDIDLLVREDDLDEVRGAVRDLGFTLESGIIRFAMGTPQERRLFRLSKARGADVLTLDLLLVTPVLEEAWKTREAYPWRGRLIASVSRDGLFRMKRLAGRLQDLADLERLEGKDPE